MKWKNGWLYGLVVVLLSGLTAPRALGDAKTLEVGQLPNAPGVYKCWYEQKVGGNTVKRPFMVFLPMLYAKPDLKLPVLVFLHGVGERGDNFDKLDTHGPIRAAQDSTVFAKGLGMIVISPQCPGDRDWTDPAMTDLVGELMDLAVAKLRGDPDRICLTGLSMGGTGTWHVAAYLANKLAAIMPICARATEQERLLQALKKVPAWIIVGGQDGDFTRDSKAMAEALRKSKNPTQITIFEREGHGVWSRVYPELRYYQWLASQKRAGGPAASMYTPEQLAEAEKKVQAADAALAEKKYPDAIKGYAAVMSKYGGSPFAQKAKEQINKLRTDPAVKAEIEEAEMQAAADNLATRAKGFDTAKDYESAQRLYEQYVKQFPKGAAFAEVKGRLDAILGDPALQAEMLQRQAEAEAGQWIKLADAYITANRPDLAKKELEKVLAKYATTTLGKQAKEKLAALP